MNKYVVMCDMKTYLKGCNSSKFILVKLQVVHYDLWVNFPFHFQRNDFRYIYVPHAVCSAFWTYSHTRYIFTYDASLRYPIHSTFLSKTPHNSQWLDVIMAFNKHGFFLMTSCGSWSHPGGSIKDWGFSFSLSQENNWLCSTWLPLQRAQNALCLPFKIHSSL